MGPSYSLLNIYLINLKGPSESNFIIIIIIIVIIIIIIIIIIITIIIFIATLITDYFT